MKRILISICAATLLSTGGFSQTAPLYYESFDNVARVRLEEKDLDSHNNRVLSGPVYSRGIKGMALDLSDDVVDRVPAVLDSSLTPDYNKDFAFSVWIKTKPGARQGTPIIGNKRNYDWPEQPRQEPGTSTSAMARNSTSTTLPSRGRG